MTERELIGEQQVQNTETQKRYSALDVRLKMGRTLL